MRDASMHKTNACKSRFFFWATLLLIAFAVQLRADHAFAANGSVAYTYDALGRVSTASYDTGVIIIYNYDANGNRTQQVINVNTGAMCWGTIAGICTTATWGAGLWHS